MLTVLENTKCNFLFPSLHDITCHMNSPLQGLLHVEYVYFTELQQVLLLSKSLVFSVTYLVSIDCECDEVGDNLFAVLFLPVILGHKNPLVDYLDFSDCQNVYGFSPYTLLELIHRTMLLFQFVHCTYLQLFVFVH